MAKVTAGITSPLLTPSVTPREGQALAPPAPPWVPATLPQEVEDLVGQTVSCPPLEHLRAESVGPFQTEYKNCEW